MEFFLHLIPIAHRIPDSSIFTIFSSGHVKEEPFKVYNFILGSTLMAVFTLIYTPVYVYVFIFSLPLNSYNFTI
ncbi:MAG: hypothetical protein BWY27_00860 [Bacteroidetes bacterium ADurb.Bin234]|nr:MAG: hypothetical protein BWY27_00860 [Bacteroidetes bacterium ADurb.Bin234]